MPTIAQKHARKRSPVSASDAELLEQCALFDIHRLSRVLTGMYNQHMRETGMTMAQFALLRNIAAMAPAGITQIATAMLMDRTSLTRLIEPLIAKGLLDTQPGEDRRVRNVIITQEGLNAVHGSESAWQHAQRELLELVGPSQWRATRSALRTTLKLVRSGDRNKIAD